MFSQKKAGIIVLERNSLYFYGSNILNTVLRLDFPPEIARDLEIFDKQKISDYVKSFILNNRISSANLLLILSQSVIFEKILPPMEQDKLEIEMQKFLDNVPFENIISRNFSIDKNYRIIATNKTFVDIVKAVFETKGFVFESTLPYFFVKQNSNSGIDLQSAKNVLNNFDSLKQQNYSIHDQNISMDRIKNSNEVSFNAIKNKKTISLILISLFSVCLLGFLIFKNFFSKPVQIPEKEPLAPSATQEIILPTPTVIPEVTSEPEEKSATSSANINTNLKIRVINASGIAKNEETFVKKLEKLGFKNIEVKNEKATNSEKTLVIFLNSVDIQTREIITDETQKIFPNIAVQQTIQSDSDCIIVIGKTL